VSTARIALANLRYAASAEESVALVVCAIGEAAGADVVCFPECYVPGYRAAGKGVPPPDPVFLERAWSTVAAAARKSNAGVVLGTERLVDGALLASALVVDRDGTIAGFQDKVQLDPSEEGLYAAGCGRRVFHVGPLTFGVVICHEGWRYPETSAGVSATARRSYSIRSSTRRRPEGIARRASAIRRIRFTRRLRCAAPPRIAASLRP